MIVRSSILILVLATHVALVTGGVGAEGTNAPAGPEPAVAAGVAEAEPKAPAAATPGAPSPVAAPTNAAPAAVAAAQPAKAPATNAVARLSLESFAMIADKNIFNQSRSPRVSSNRPPVTNEVKRVPKIEVFALVGTMSYAKGDFAFFDSSNGSYRKTAKAGDEIAGYKIQAVNPNQVTLDREGNALDVKVGQQLRREDDGPWEVSTRTEAFASGSSTSGSTSGTSGASSATSSSTSGSRSEILQRLLEQRAKAKQ